PGVRSEPAARKIRVLPYLVLLQAGFTVPRNVATRAVRSYRTFSPLPARFKEARLGGIFSVALSMDSRPPGVTWRLVRRSPDFPPAVRFHDTASDCLADSHLLEPRMVPHCSTRDSVDWTAPGVHRSGVAA